jgi:IK cytokine
VWVDRYRDRAEERRKNVNPDYDGVKGMETDDVLISKHLGGDMEHTHLVKGLDLNLMMKARWLLLL